MKKTDKELFDEVNVLKGRIKEIKGIVRERKLKELLTIVRDNPGRNGQDLCEMGAPIREENGFEGVLCFAQAKGYIVWKQGWYINEKKK